MTTQKHVLCGITTLSLVAPFAGFANSAAFESGFYVGAKIGTQQMMADQHLTSDLSIVQQGLNPSSATFYSEQSFSSDDNTNVMGNFAIGYAFITGRFFLAPELAVNLSTEQEVSADFSEEIDKFSLPSGVAIQEENIHSETSLKGTDIIFDLKSGFLLAKNFLLYGRVGVAFNELTIEQEGTVDYIYAKEPNHSVVFITPITSSNEEAVYGLRLGLGMEYKLSSNLAMNIDYVFTDYGSVETEFNTPYTFVDGTETVTTNSNITSKADITKNIGAVGFNWYF